MVYLKGEIVGRTKCSEDKEGIPYMEFFVKDIEVDTEVKIVDMAIRGLHENLLPKRRIALSYEPRVINWCDKYSLLDKKGNAFYRAHAN